MKKIRGERKWENGWQRVIREVLPLFRRDFLFMSERHLREIVGEQK